MEEKECCSKCGFPLDKKLDYCPDCSAPTAPDNKKNIKKRFTLYFILLVIFCFVLIFLLPRDIP